MSSRISTFCFLVFFFITSCKKDSASSSVVDANSPAQNATLVASGNLSFPFKNNSGTASVYKQQTGNYQLAVEGANLSLGRSLVIYLSATPNVSPSSIKICSIRSLAEDLYRDLPSGLDFTLFKYVVILVEPSEEIVGSAILA